MSTADPHQSGPAGEPKASRWRFADGVPPVWLRRVTVAVGVVAVLVLLAVVGSIVLPGWWAGVVTGWVQGITSAGIIAGLLCGAVFTAIPAGIIAYTVRSSWQWRTRLIVAAVAAVLALPNVLTLVIDVGRTSSALDARLDMVIGAPAFTGATLVGVIVALVGVIGGVLGWRWLRRSRAELRAARGEAPRRRWPLGRRRTTGAATPGSETDATGSGPRNAKGGGVQ